MPNRFFDIESFALNALLPWSPEMARVRAGKALFYTAADLRLLSGVAGGVILVKAGMLTDLASVPREGWSVFFSPDDPRIAAGAVVHDFLYGKEGKITLEDGRAVALSREQCDLILTREAMHELGASFTQQTIVYLALREFGRRWSDGQ